MLVHIAVVAITIVLMALGLIGSVVPMVPGSWLILLGACIYAWHTDFAIIGWGVVGILAVLTVCSQFLDNLASLLGAKKFGASRWGIIGAFLGGAAGLFAGIAGIIIGPFLGAVIGEMARGQTMDASLKIGIGTLVGFLGGALGRLVIAVIMIGICLLHIIR